MSASRRTAGLSSLLLAALLLAGCATATPSSEAPTRETAPAPPGTPARGTVIFDMGHGEIFSADDTSELGQSMAVQAIRDAGFEVVVNADALTAEELAGAKGVILPGPMRPLTGDEYAALDQFVRSGGTAVVTIHVPFPVLSVPAHWGLPVKPFVMVSETPLPGAGDASVFLADQITESALTQGVEDLLVISGWPVEATGDQAEIVAATGPEAWADTDRDDARTAADLGGPLGVVGISKVGDGQVIVVGDDAIFANIGMGQADNARLFENVLRVIGGSLEV